MAAVAFDPAHPSLQVNVPVPPFFFAYLMSIPFPIFLLVSLTFPLLPAGRLENTQVPLYTCSLFRFAVLTCL